LAVRELDTDHDSSDLALAMQAATDTSTPALGLYYTSQRETLGQALDQVALRAGAAAESTSLG
jgi:hypothetical protein